MFSLQPTAPHLDFTPNRKSRPSNEIRFVPKETWTSAHKFVSTRLNCILTRRLQP